MGRYISTTGGPTSTIASMKALDNLAIGDVVASGVSGKVGYVSTNNATPNRTSDDPVSTTPFLPLGSVGYETPRFNRSILSNIIFKTGEEFMAYTGNGISINSNAGYYNFSTGIKTDMYVGGGMYVAGFEKLNETSFLFLTTTLNYGAIQFSIMNKDGVTAVKALTVLATINSYDGIDISSNGVDRIFIVYSTVAGNYLSILDYSGTVVGTPIQLSTVGSNFTKVKSLANGNVLTLYSKLNIGFFTKQFTAQGVAIGVELQLSTSVASRLLNTSSKRLINSVGANIYVLAFGSTGSTDIHKISETNTLISAIQQPYISTAFSGDILVTASGNILVTHLYSSNIGYGLYSPDLGLILGGTYNGNNTSVAGENINNNLFVTEVPNGYALFISGFSGTNYGATVCFVTPTFAITGVALVLVLTSGTFIPNSIFKHEGEIHLSGAYSVNTNYPCKRIINAGKQSIIGVSTSTALAGGDVNIMIEGEATLSKNYSLIGAFDLRASVPYGNRGIIVGNKAAMFGIKV